MAGPTLQNLMQHALSLVQVGLAAGGVVVMVLNLSLSKWAWAPLVGFAMHAIVVIASAAVTFALQYGALNDLGGDAHLISAIFMMIRATGLLGWLLIVGGLWGVFSDIQRRWAK